ncbi:hypothetical protein AWENTII_000971 [Aspergillus wentii]
MSERFSSISHPHNNSGTKLAPPTVVAPNKGLETREQIRGLFDGRKLHTVVVAKNQNRAGHGSLWIVALGEIPGEGKIIIIRRIDMSDNWMCATPSKPLYVLILNSRTPDPPLDVIDKDSSPILEQKG